MKRAIALAMVLCLLMGAAFAETRIIVSDSAVTVKETQRAALYVIAVPAEDTEIAPLVWESDDESIAEVTAGGEVIGVKAGETNVRVRLPDTDAEAVCRVTVEPFATQLTLPVTVKLPLLETISLEAQFVPEERKDMPLVWSSNSPYVAPVDQNGNVTALAKGVAVITAYVRDDPAARSRCAVTVTDAVLKDISIPAAMTLGVKEKAQIEPLRIPKQAVDEIAFRSGNEKIATVDETGKITAVSEGKCAVYAMGGGVRRATVVNVVKAPTKLEMNEKQCTIGKGETRQLQCLFKDGEAGSLTWSSNGKSVVVDQSGFITAVGVAKNTITAKAYNGKTATCAVYVKEAPVTASFRSGNIRMANGESVQTEIVTEKKAGGTLTYATSDEHVAQVTQDGLVTAVGQGACIVTARFYNGVGAQIQVTVTK